MSPNHASAVIDPMLPLVRVTMTTLTHEYYAHLTPDEATILANRMLRMADTIRDRERRAREDLVLTSRWSTVKAHKQPDDSGVSFDVSNTIGGCEFDLDTENVDRLVKFLKGE